MVYLMKNIFVVFVCILLFQAVGKGNTSSDSPRPSGYYFLSARLLEVQDSTKQSALISIDTILTDYSDAKLHGPFRSKFIARRALREYRREQRKKIFCTSVFKM